MERRPARVPAPLLGPGATATAHRTAFGRLATDDAVAAQRAAEVELVRQRRHACYASPVTGVPGGLPLDPLDQSVKVDLVEQRQPQPCGPLEKQVRIRTVERDRERRLQRTQPQPASTPSRRGMLKSRTATSSRCSHASSIASAPSLASNTDPDAVRLAEQLVEQRSDRVVVVGDEQADPRRRCNGLRSLRCASGSSRIGWVRACPTRAGAATDSWPHLSVTPGRNGVERRWRSLSSRVTLAITERRRK